MPVLYESGLSAGQEISMDSLYYYLRNQQCLSNKILKHKQHFSISDATGYYHSYYSNRNCDLYHNFIETF